MLLPFRILSEDSTVMGLEPGFSDKLLVNQAQTVSAKMRIKGLHYLIFYFHIIWTNCAFVLQFMVLSPLRIVNLWKLFLPADAGRISLPTVSSLSLLERALLASGLKSIAKVLQ